MVRGRRGKIRAEMKKENREYENNTRKDKKKEKEKNVK